MAQERLSSVSEMRWGLDYNLFLSLENDSTYNIDIRDLFHVPKTSLTEFSSEFVYYPVDFDLTFVQRFNSSGDTTFGTEYKTLWAALHNDIGGGWPHFANCLLFALESGTLKLNSPLMERPVTKWKPNPMTETYKRTRKWKYYTPYSQKESTKEYNLRVKEGKLGDVQNLPSQFIDMFLTTSQKEYNAMRTKGFKHDVAKIDMVKLLLGVNYLSDTQISYIRSAVFNAIKRYSNKRLPSIIIFDEFHAAAMMKMDANGYFIEKIVFNPNFPLNTEEAQQRVEEINRVIIKINEYNRIAFQKRLDGYYNAL